MHPSKWSMSMCVQLPTKGSNFSKLNIYSLRAGAERWVCTRTPLSCAQRPSLCMADAERRYTGAAGSTFPLPRQSMCGPTKNRCMYCGSLTGWSIMVCSTSHSITNASSSTRLKINAAGRPRR
eukprot:7379760-Prymnesium_polylepis.2